MTFGDHSTDNWIFFLSTNTITVKMKDWILPGYKGFYRVLLGFTGTWRVTLGFHVYYRVPPDLIGFCRVLLGFTGFC